MYEVGILKIDELKRDTPYFAEFITMLLNAVGAPSSVLDEPEFYMKYTWTFEEEAAFEKMAVAWFKANREARQEFGLPAIKGYVEQLVRELLLCYGWKYKDVKK